LIMLQGSVRVSAQTHYVSGQNVVPVFEGWESNPDGTFNMVFGYMNRNYEEEVDIPVGPNNSIEPGGVDQGQPTHFYARRQQFVFKVKVPKDWGKKDLVWTLNVRGRVEKAYATMLPFWELGNLVYQENRGGPGDIGDEDEPNAPPSIALVGPSRLTAGVGQSLTLTAAVTDDGHPAPRVVAAGRRGQSAPPVQRDSDGAVVPPAAGRGQAPAASAPPRASPLTQAVVRLDRGVRLGVTWVVYRGTGAGAVTFDPMHVAVVNGQAITRVSFREAGAYVLRGYADDGVLVTPVDVTVTVTDRSP
jgi:hypothetical protein